MTVEDGRVGLANEDKFPMGLRVLAVDDDPICLKVLENLLRKCQYHVTTTNQAITALKMLRENRSNYDLVISDVNMPDMDGFKLLELVGFEMDLPVIMLSAHSDKELVYKGVTHGAVDYLLKPVRLEELKNIWQHVIRRKKFCPKDQNHSPNQDKSNEVAGKGGQGVASTGSSDPSGKVNRKRKDQYGEEEEGEGEENGHENEESGTQKKPRVVWSVELHRKFVAAVNQLGLEKAVPKKILDLMNVEGLTRENVASHLQKYRLYLKRISSAASQQANMVAAFGGKDSSYLQMASLDGYGDFRTLNGPGRISSASLSSYPSRGVLGRLNSSSGLTLRGITSSGLLQPGHSQTLSNSVNMLGKIQPTLLLANQSTNLQLTNELQGRSTNHIGEFNPNGNITGFTIGTSFPDSKVTIGRLANTMPSALSNPLKVQVNSQQIQNRGGFAAQSSLHVPSMKQESFDVGVHGSSSVLDRSRCSDNWQDAVQLSQFPSNSLPLSEPLSHDPLHSNSMRDNISSTSSRIGNIPIEFSSSCALTSSLEDSRLDMQGQASLIGNVIQNMNYTSDQRWEKHSQDHNSSLHNSFSTMNSQDQGPNINNSFSIMNSLASGNGNVGPLNRSLDETGKFDASIFQHTEIEKAALDPKIRPNGDYLLQHSKSQNGFIQNNCDSLDDMMNVMMKQDKNETMLMDGDFGFDAYSFESCM